ncbi:MAG TPA: glycosyltransferase family 4 protein [Candidatus Krumholzibacteria bacterium]|nr:glycosyltransferase family 4 protein [Candidatus Krumholzibacteria bacterium]
MPGTILHVLSQRPSLTGSGVALDALVRHADRDGWRQAVVVGVPAAETAPAVGGLPSDRIRPLRFGGGALPYPVPGMSDVMPYRSTRFSSLDEAQLEGYRAAWRGHLLDVIADVRPDVIHAHHVWLVGALLKDVAPAVPVVTHCHATGFRQMALCPHLAYEVREGVRRNDAFCVLHQGHAAELANILDVAPERIHVVGNGYREDLFHAAGATGGRAGQVLYSGKSSDAKGVPWLLDAVERLGAERPGLTLHMAGGGTGEQAERIHRRVAELGALVRHHGQLSQAELAELMRGCAVCVLPSFYEGVPLVLVEALASGCRLVSTRLPGVLDRLAPTLGRAMELVDLPRLEAVDVPHAPDLPRFTDDLAAALERALDAPPLDAGSAWFASALAPFTWGRVYDRVARLWRELLERPTA